MTWVTLASFSSSALTSFGSPLASANASVAIVKMYRDWICIVPLYPGIMPSLPKPKECRQNRFCGLKWLATQAETPCPASKRNHQCNRVRKVLQPVTRCGASRLREAGNVIETHEHAGDFKESLSGSKLIGLVRNPYG